MPIVHHIRKKKMGLSSIVLSFMFILNITLSPLKAEELKTINVSMPTNYGTFFGEIHYSQKDLQLALSLERIIKEDLIKVINYFEYVPHDVVHFNLDPYLRLTNGNARTFPTNIINLYPFPSNNLEHLIVMENWLQGLVLHEFVHITHLDQTRDYMDFGRQIFGTIAKLPAAVVPRWFTEGIAVWGESYLLNGGRLHLPLFNKELWLLFNNQQNCQNIDCLDNPGFYPNGQLAYWAGAHFIEYIENKKPKTIKCLVEENSKAIPFFLNNAFEACIGESAQELFLKFRTEYINSYVSPENTTQLYGEKITNAFGRDDFQKNFVLDGDHLYKLEHQRQSEALVSYDLLDKVSFTAFFNAPISDISAMVEVSKVDEDNDSKDKKVSKLLLVAFNDDPNFRDHNKVWKYVDPETLLVERTLSFPHDPSYVLPIQGEDFLTVSFWENHWQIERGGEVLIIFPTRYNITMVKKVGEQILLKINDSFGVSSLVISDLKFKKFEEIYTNEKSYDLPIVTDKFLIVRVVDQLQFIEINPTVQLGQLPNSLLANITSLTFNENHTLTLADGLRSLEKKQIDSEKEILSLVTNKTSIATKEYKILPDQMNSYDSKLAESYPRLDHLLPHYWFLALGSSDNLGSFGAMTTLSDPMEVHSLDAKFFVYPSVSRIGGTLDYTQKLVSISDLWSINLLADQDYSVSNIDSTLNQTFDLNFSTNYKMLLKRWTYSPGYFMGSSKTEDFISSRKTSMIGVTQSLDFQALTFNDTFQSLNIVTKLQANNASFGNTYLASKSEVSASFRVVPEWLASFKIDYSRFFKSDFTRGVTFAGGVSNFVKARFHEFYGLPYGDAYGNEIFSSRLMMDYNFKDIYRGKNLLPLYFREAHILLGQQSLFANRTYLDGKILKEKMINGFFMGPRIKMDLFYYVPTDIDFIFSTILNPNGNNVNQVEFSLSAQAF